MASLSQKGELGLPMWSQILSSDHDLKLQSASDGLWSKSGPRPVLMAAVSCKKKQRRMYVCEDNGQPSLSIGGDLSGLHKGRHDS